MTRFVHMFLLGKMKVIILYDIALTFDMELFLASTQLFHISIFLRLYVFRTPFSFQFGLLVHFAFLTFSMMCMFELFRATYVLDFYLTCDRICILDDE